MTPDTLLEQHRLPLPAGDLHAAALCILACDAQVEATHRQLLVSDAASASAKAAYEAAITHLLTAVRAYRQALQAAADPGAPPDAEAGPGYLVKISGVERYLASLETVTGRHWTWTDAVVEAYLFDVEAEARAATREAGVTADEVEILLDPMAVDPTGGEGRS
jgi:hypothetical protein